MFVKLINMYTPILAFLYEPINLGVQIRKGDCVRDRSRQVGHMCGWKEQLLGGNA